MGVSLRGWFRFGALALGLAAAGGGLRMARESVSAQTLVDEILADGEFESVEERCQLIPGIAENSPTWGPARYAALPACAAFPFAPR
jgi:hypothetical protein